MLKKIFIAMAMLCGMQTMAESTDSISYVPHIHGVVRGRFEASTEQSDYRFQVRNARVTLDGNIAPFADYFVQVDFCDRGSIKILDAWARLWATKSIGFQAGQFRMPFGVDPFKAPNNYIFANRSFIGKYTCNVRAVGAKAIWHPDFMPVTLEAGAFNPGTINDHSKWHNTLTFATKATAKADNVTFATGFQSVKPTTVRANLFDAAATWQADRWTVEGEYMYKHYTRNRYKNSHSYNVWANYSMPIKTQLFNRLSFQGRFDGITDQSSATPGDDGLLFTDFPSCNRFTVGSTISYVRTKTMYLDLRANYEKFLYHHDTPHSLENSDKIVVELVLRF